MARPEMPSQLPAERYQVVLLKIIDEDNEGRPLMRSDINNPSNMVRYQDWIFMVEGGEHDGEEIQVRTSLKYSPKGKNPASKGYLFAEALCGGSAPSIATFDFQDLVGKQALADIEVNEKGYSCVEKLRPIKQAAKPAPEKGFSPTPSKTAPKTPPPDAVEPDTVPEEDLDPSIPF